MKQIDVDEFIRKRLAACRRGGQQSARTRRAQAKRRAVEHAVRYQISVRTYDRDTASKIARYLGVSARYVRLVASEVRKEAETN